MIIAPFGIVIANAAVLITLEVFEEDGRTVCGIYQLSGKIRMPPKAWVRAVRTEVTRLERIARAAGCEELRLGGRDWSKILSGMGFTPLDGIPNGLGKAL